MYVRTPAGPGQIQAGSGSGSGGGGGVGIDSARVIIVDSAGGDGVESSISAAVTAINNLVPLPSNVENAAAIVVKSAEELVGDFTLPAYTKLIAPKATVTGKITMGEASTVEVYTHKSLSVDYMVQLNSSFVNTALPPRVYRAERIFPSIIGSTGFFNCSAASGQFGEIIAHVNKAFITGDGALINISTAAVTGSVFGQFYFDQLEGSGGGVNCKLVNISGTSNNCIKRIKVTLDKSEDFGGNIFCNNGLFTCNSGELDLDINKLNVSNGQCFDIGANGTVRGRIGRGTGFTTASVNAGVLKVDFDEVDSYDEHPILSAYNSDLAHHWTFEEGTANPTDQVGAANMTSLGTSFIAVNNQGPFPGRKAIGVEAANSSYVETAAALGAAVSGDFTISCWVRPIEGGNNLNLGPGLSDPAIAVGTQFMSVRTLNSGGRYGTNTENTNEIDVDASRPYGPWSHVAIARDVSESKSSLWVDGVKIGEVDGSASTVDHSTSFLQFGRERFSGFTAGSMIYSVSNPRVYDAYIDDPEFFKQAAKVA